MYTEQKCNTCGKNTPVEEMPLTMAYVPWQEWKHLYEIEKGFECGTIFKDLDKKYVGCK